MLYFLLSTLVLTLYIDVVLSLSIKSQQGYKNHIVNLLVLPCFIICLALRRDVNCILQLHVKFNISSVYDKIILYVYRSIHIKPMFIYVEL